METTSHAHRWVVQVPDGTVYSDFEIGCEGCPTSPATAEELYQLGRRNGQRAAELQISARTQTAKSLLEALKIWHVHMDRRTGRLHDDSFCCEVGAMAEMAEKALEVS